MSVNNHISVFTLLESLSLLDINLCFFLQFFRFWISLRFFTNKDIFYWEFGLSVILLKTGLNLSFFIVYASKYRDLSFLNNPRGFLLEEKELFFIFCKAICWISKFLNLWDDLLKFVFDCLKFAENLLILDIGEDFLLKLIFD